MSKISWKDVYKLPLEYDGYTYCWSKNGTMSIMFSRDVSEKDRKRIVDSINGKSSSKIDGLTSNGPDFYQDNQYLFCVRGWGYLTGIGGLNLPEKKAIKLQDDFINHVLDKLK